MSYAPFLLCFLLAQASLGDDAVTSIDLSGSSLVGWVNGTCSMRLLFCDPVSVCEEGHVGTNDTYYRCSCPHGIEGDGYLNGTGCSSNRTDCYMDRQCHQYGFCDQTLKYCRCKPGFSGDGAQKCDDINECESSPCHQHARCDNNAGGFICTCDIEHQYEGNGSFCEHRCNTEKDCHPDAVCNSTQRRCQCKSGYTGTGVNCTDINECQEENVCPEGSTCVNSVGSFRCDCNNGFYRQNDGDFNCTEAPRDCEEIRQRGITKSGDYLIDPDFIGPAKLFQVKCEFRNEYAVTILPILNRNNRLKLKGDYLVDYGTDFISLQVLLARSYFCMQSTALSCHSSFQYTEDFFWRDAFNQSHTAWAGSSVEGMCGCGQLGKCDRCQCGKRSGKAVDKGLFVDKIRLPITSIRLPVLVKTAVDIGSLMCGPRVFDIPADCNGWRVNHNRNDAYYIDVDGPFGDPPFLVYCDLETFPHVGVTEMQVQRNSIQLTKTGEESLVTYIQGLKNVQKLVNFLDYCMQDVTYLCQNSRITGNRVFVNVTSENRQLTYFPGANREPDSCACGATRSCQDTTLRCNCDIEDGEHRRDLGTIIHKEDLPVVSVTGGSGQGANNTFVVSNLRCAPVQFGIQPNCEKIRGLAGFDLFQYSYFIDPDGPAVSKSSEGNVRPFLVECMFQDYPVHGITIVHHSMEREVRNFISLVYQQADVAQLKALKVRSTYCLQNITIGCRKFSLSYNDSDRNWVALDGSQIPLKSSLQSCTEDGNCNCNGTDVYNEDAGTLNDLDSLPVTGLLFADVMEQLKMDPNATAKVTVGPLKCSELFTTCGALQAFVNKRKSLGETLPEAESSITIDPDSAGPVQAFEAQCSWPDTVVTPVAPGNRGEITVKSPDSKSHCFEIVYKDDKGNVITPEQLVSLRDASKNCFQTLSVQCLHAKVHGKVNFTTCDGVTQVGWAGSIGKDSCACGVGGHCQGGTEFKCNCDLQDGTIRKDGGVIITRERLPVCQVCLSLDGIPHDLRKTVPKRHLAFSVSRLNCHPGRGRHVRDKSSCQVVRQESHVARERTDIVYMNPDSPIPVGCRLMREPAVGQLEIFPQKQVHTIPDKQRVNITVEYYTVNMTIVHVLMTQHVYCLQHVFFFCLPPETEVTFKGNDGWLDIEGNVRRSWDTLMEEEITRSTVCTDYSLHCKKCGPPKGFVVYQKSSLPITGLILSLKGPFTVVVESVRCHDLFENCYEILKDGTQKRNNRRTYTIDPDGAGGVEPFAVQCSFQNNPQCALTKTPVEQSFKEGTHVNGVFNSGGVQSTVTYGKISADQIKALTNVSQFCWQPVSFDCQAARLINNDKPAISFYNTGFGNASSSFGTGRQTDVIGCACALTGTCGKDDIACRCDAAKPEMARDGGVVSRKTHLPITGLTMAGQETQQSVSVMRIGDVTCSNDYCRQFPRDCQEALDWGNRNGIDYSQSGEYFIQPMPALCAPFAVFCEMDIAKRTGVTRIVPKTREDTVLTPGQRTEHGYYIPSSEQLRCLIEESAHCFQPVAYECYRAKLIGGGVKWEGSHGTVSHQWGGAVSHEHTCACGASNQCGGLDSRADQLLRKCNCDAMDSHWRKDAGLLTLKHKLPVTAMDLTALTPDPDSRVNLTLGDLYCSQKPRSFDECSTGFHDCAEHATCTDTPNGYRCTCNAGWEGRNNHRSQDDTIPVANGRQCIDDDECSFNKCPVGRSACFNTPGSFYCVCNSGYTQTGPTTCKDIDECSEGTHDCDTNAKCVNQDGTFRCVCHRNYRGSGRLGDCHGIGTCTIFGDPHTRSFDGKWNHYQGTPMCQYVASSDRCQDSGTGTFQVLVTMWTQGSPSVDHFSHFTWVKELEIHVKDRVVKMLQNRELMVDGKQTFGYQESGLVIFETGRQLILQTKDGLEISWDGVEKAQVIVSKAFKGRLCGLCGNMNDDPSDDWIVGPACDGNGTVTTKLNVFGDSWVGGKPRCRAECDPKGPPDGFCMMDKATAQNLCSQLYDSTKTPFRQCITEMDAGLLDGLLESCVFDLCQLGNNNSIICSHAETLVLECQTNYRITINNWRRPDFCGMDCHGNMTYSTCGPNPDDPTESQISCIDLGASSNISRGLSNCVEGCFCNPGYVLDGPRCVLRQDCGCYANGTYLPVGYTVTKTQCGPAVVCQSSGKLEDVVLQCGDHASCVPSGDNSTSVCTCHTGFLGDGFTCKRDPCYNVTCPPNSERIGLRCKCEAGYVGEDCRSCKANPCLHIKCSKLSHCVNGKCICKPGYVGECNSCQDVDECASKTDNCHGEGEVCHNIPGSYLCKCDIGYVRTDRGCEDVDECASGLNQCPAHSECFNKRGMYACMCCVGYSMDKHGRCVLKDHIDTQYIDPNATDSSTCCSCNTPECDKPGMVCGTNGVTYSNIRAMIAQTCLHEKRVHPMYEGRCKKNCSQVRCSQPFATCEVLPDELAVCTCPFCDPYKVIRITDAVCGSDGRLYRTECEFRAAMCVSSTDSVSIVTNSSLCSGPGGSGGAVNSSGWTSCSAPCGQGEVHRTVTSLSPPHHQYTLSAVCFSTCTDEQACDRFHCEGPGKECLRLRGGPVCTCPLCGHLSHRPVCGQVKDQISTYRNLCELKAAACLLHVPYILLDGSAPCQPEPIDCAVAQNFHNGTDARGCYTKVPYDFGRCAGGCGSTTDKCCYTTSVLTRTVPFVCPDGSSLDKTVKVITGCRCVGPGELARLKKQFGQ